MSAAQGKGLSQRETLAGDSQRQGNTTPERRVAGNSLAAQDAPGDITATDLFDIATEALRRCNLWPRELEPGSRTRAQTLGLLATMVAVMRDRGWTVLPPGHHRPIDPR